MTADTWRDQIAAAIAVHWFTVNSETLADPGSRRAWISCRCGWFGENLDPDTVPEREREKGRHVADAVMPILAAAVAEARAEAWREGYDRAWADHCDYYPTIAECDAFSPNPYRQHVGEVAGDASLQV